MGVLYAKVGGAWTPILNSAGSGDPAWPNGYPTYDPRYVNVTGDTMTGMLTVTTPTGTGLRVVQDGDSPYMEYRGTTTRYGYIMGRGGSLTDPGLRVAADSNPIMLWTNGTESFRVRVNSTGEIASLMSAASGDHYLGFRNNGATGAREGWVGFSSSWIRLRSENARSIIVESADDVRLTAAGQYIDLYTNNTFRARLDGGTFVLGKSAADIQVAGSMINPNGFTPTNDALNAPGITINKIGAGNANGCDFQHMRRGNTTVGSITSPSPGNTAYNTTSDYRVKDDRGPIERPLERIKVLRPIRAHFHEDEDLDHEVETFIAHEVAEVVPEAVTGAKDAVDEDGEIARQQLDMAKLIPLLVASVQELTTEVEQLRAEVAQLKGAA